MHYSMHLDVLSASLERIENGCDTLVINGEFTHAWQEDGHMPSDGDMKKSFAEAVIGSMPREKIVQVMKDYNITGITSNWGRPVSCITVKPTNRRVFCMPVFEFELRICFTPAEDLYDNAVQTLLKNVDFNKAKEELYKYPEMFTLEGRTNELA